MLLIILIMQVILTQIINQSHELVLSALKREDYRLPPVSRSQRLAALQNNSTMSLVAQTPERQYFSAQSRICDQDHCIDFIQFFSVGSAIFREELSLHAIKFVDP